MYCKRKGNARIDITNARGSNSRAFPLSDLDSTPPSTQKKEDLTTLLLF